MVNNKFIGTGKKITLEEIKGIATFLQVELAALQAVLDVEARSSGFNSDNSPTILYEPHIAYARAATDTARTKLINAGVAYKNQDSSKYPKSYIDRYKQLEKAIEIVGNSAYEYASFGMPQIMGFNYHSAGFRSAIDMFEAFKQSEKIQVEAMAVFIQSIPKLHQGLKDKDWDVVAYYYNGKNYAKGNYHKKLRDRYDYRVKNSTSEATETLPEVSLMNVTETLLITQGVSAKYAKNLANKLNTLDITIRNRFTQMVIDFYKKYGPIGYALDINQATRTEAEQKKIQATGVKSASPTNTWHVAARSGEGGAACDFSIFKNEVYDNGTKAQNAYVTVLREVGKVNRLVNPISNDVGHFMPEEVPLARAGKSVRDFVKVFVVDDGSLSRGDKGPQVKLLQEYLNNVIIQGMPTLNVDGDFGRLTEDAVKKYQELQGLEVTGIVTKSQFDALSKILDDRPVIEPEFEQQKNPETIKNSEKNTGFWSILWSIIKSIFGK